MRVPPAARARKGKPIKPAWEALQKWTEEPAPHPGKGTRIREMPGETLHFTSRSGTTWAHPWKPAITGAGIVVAPGFLNASMPRAGRDLLTLDGYDRDDKPTGRRPEILLDSGAGPDGRSFVCVRVVVDLESGEAAADRAPLDWLTVVHRSELPVGFQSGSMPEVLEGGYGVGYFPIAILYWQDRRVSRLFPAAHHHLQHRRYDGRENSDGTRGPNRHAFWV